MSLFENVNNTLKGEVLDGHAERNRQNLISIKNANEQLKAELQLQDNCIKFEFSKMPSKGQLKALSVLIGRANSMDDLRNAPKHAKAFENVTECNPVADTTKITIQLHSLIDDIETFIELSTNEQSDNGTFISNSEAQIIHRLNVDMDNLQLDLAKFVLNRTVGDKSE